MPRKIPEAPKYPYAPWHAPIDLDPELMEQARALAAVPRDVFATWLLDKSPEQQVIALRLRFRFDRMWFLTYCWPDIFRLPFNEYHVETLNEPKTYWRDRTKRGTVRRAVAAPRGIAKTTTAKGDIIHSAVYGLEGMIIVHSSGLEDGSEPFVRDVKTMLESSPRLAELYGAVAVTPDGRKSILKVGEAPAVPIFPKSFKTQVRGTNHNAQRPTLYVIDDGEHPDRVRNPENRRADSKFLKEDIAECGPKEGGLLIDMRGTMLHPDSLLMACSVDPAWSYKRWQAILEWPKNEHMWEKCKALWSDLTDPERRETALAFYEANREAMDEGVELLDPVAMPIFALYEKMWSNGRASFMKEIQNEIVATGAQAFDMAKVHRFKVHGDFGDRYVLVGPEGKKKKSYLHDMKIVMYLDPIPASDLGGLEVEGSGASDFAAIAVVGRDKFGYAYVFEVWCKRAMDSEQITALFNLGQKWGARQAWIESVGFSRLVTRDFNRLRAERREKGLFADVRVEEAKVSVPKDERIASLDLPLQMTNWLLINEDLDREVVKQFREWPDGAYDDGPDAVAGAYDKLGGSAPETRGKPMRVVG
jgi:predicted phage terminase large subunit-like protein